MCFTNRSHRKYICYAEGKNPNKNPLWDFYDDDLEFGDDFAIPLPVDMFEKVLLSKPLLIKVEVKEDCIEVSY